MALLSSSAGAGLWGVCAVGLTTSTIVPFMSRLSEYQVGHKHSIPTLEMATKWMIANVVINWVLALVFCVAVCGAACKRDSSSAPLLGK